MNLLKRLLNKFRDPFGDKKNLAKQEADFREVTSQVVDLQLARHPYRSLNRACRHRDSTRGRE